MFTHIHIARTIFQISLHFHVFLSCKEISLAVQLNYWLPALLLKTVNIKHDNGHNVNVKVLGV